MVEMVSRKRVRRYLHYDDYVVEFNTSGYSADEISEIKSAHDLLGSACPNLLRSGKLFGARFVFRGGHGY